MRQFSDKENGKWTIDLPVGTVLRVKAGSAGKFDLFSPEKKIDELPLQQLLYDNYGEFWELLWLIVEEDAERRGVTAVQFGKLVAAECLVAAQSAFFAEWHDFFQGLQRPDKAAVLEKMQKYQQKAMELVRAKMQDPRMAELDARTERQMQSSLEKSFSDLLASSEESTTGDTPGEN